jgi:hypothetical protein
MLDEGVVVQLRRGSGLFELQDAIRRGLATPDLAEHLGAQCGELIPGLSTVK